MNIIRNFTSVTKQYDIPKTTFINYKVIENENTLIVPIDTANTDYQAVQEWAAVDGNTIAEAD
tara:strand:- start:241 stop:429 length:189 start_codon:yes stop_codon:yes gene_type:complete